MTSCSLKHPRGKLCTRRWPAAAWSIHEENCALEERRVCVIRTFSGDLLWCSLGTELNSFYQTDLLFVFPIPRKRRAAKEFGILSLEKNTRWSMVLIYGGSSQNVAHIWNRSFLKKKIGFGDSLGVNKCLQQIDIHHLFHMYVPCSELHSNIRTMHRKDFYFCRKLI